MLLVCAIVAVAGLFCSRPARAQLNPRATASGNKLPEGTIVDIQVEGNKTVDTEEVIRKLASRVGRPLERKSIEKDIRNLLESQLFSDVQPFFDKSEKGDGYVLIFKVKEMPLVGRVEYRGRKGLKLKQLEEATGIKAGGRADAIKARLGEAALERLYHEKGYQKATVKLLSGDKADDKDVVYEIFEGPKFTVSHVDFLGNTFASDAVLRTKISSKPPKLGLIGGGFSREEMEEDARKLREYYQGQGFFEIAISAVDEPGSDLGHRKVTFVISEGPQYKVRNIKFEGTQKIDEATLREGLALHSRQPFRDEYRDADKKKIIEKYGNIGCIDARIDVEPKFTQEPGIVDLVYKIDEGEQYLLGEIIVKGNDRTKEKVVRREAEMAGLVPGEPLNANLIETFQKRLQGTQYFVASPEMGRPLNISITNRRPHDKPYGEGVIPGLSLAGLTRLQDSGDELPSATGSVPLGAPPEAGEKPPVRVAQAPSAGTILTQPAEGGQILDGTAALPPALPPADSGPLLMAPPPAVINVPGSVVVPPGTPGSSATVTPDNIPGTAPVGSGEPAGSFPDIPGLNMNDVGPDRQEPFANRSFADITTSLEEAPTGRFMFGVGASSFGGLSGNFIVHEKNFDIFNLPKSWSDVTNGQAFRGGGQEFRFEAMPGTLINRLMVSFRDPYLFDLPVALNLSGYAFTRAYPNWNEKRGGGRFSLGRQFGTSIYADLATTVEEINFYGYASPPPADYLAASGNTVIGARGKEDLPRNGDGKRHVLARRACVGRVVIRRAVTCCDGHLDDRSFATCDCIARHTVDRRTECTQERPQRNVFAVRHTPHLVVARSDAAHSVDNDLGIGEAVLGIFGDANREGCIEPLRFAGDRLEGTAISELGYVDYVLWPHDEIKVIVLREQSCRRHVTVEYVAWVRVDGEHTLWSTTLYQSNSYGVARLASAWRDNTQHLQKHHDGDHRQCDTARVPTEFRPLQPEQCKCATENGHPPRQAEWADDTTELREPGVGNAKCEARERNPTERPEVTKSFDQGERSHSRHHT